jgi:hypothetical protein
MYIAIILWGDETAYHSKEFKKVYIYDIYSRISKFIFFYPFCYLILGGAYFEFMDSMLTNFYYKLITHGLLWFP